MPRDDPGDAGMPPCPGRRALLTLGAAVVVATSLGACGIRLEDDAPRVPLVPTREPVPAEAFLVGLWRSSQVLADRAEAVGGAATGLPARLAKLHTEQATVLRAELLRLGVPQNVLDRQAAPVTTSGGATTSSTTAPSGPPTSTRATAGTPTRALLAAAELADAGSPSLASLTQTSDATRALAGALLAQRLSAATLLGGKVTPVEPTWQAPSLAASFLDSTRAAVYAFQVVTAQSAPGPQGTLAAATLDALQVRAEVQESLAGDSAGAAALGYPLPFAVTSPRAARRLAVQVLTELRSANARELESAGSDAEPLTSVVQWLAETEVLASRWGVALAPFPGLR